MPSTQALADPFRGTELLRGRPDQPRIRGGDLTPQAAAEAIAHEVRRFIDEIVIPNEPVLSRADASAHSALSELAAQARGAGLWGLFYPGALGGKIASLEDYLIVAEQEGRSEYGPAIFGCEAAVDAWMLHGHGNDRLHREFLEPMVSGQAIPSYGMSEPDSVGSSPATIKTSARLLDGAWIVNGRKWFVCRADRATFLTVVAMSDAEAAPDRGLSMIVLPTRSPGFKIERRLDIFGRFQGQCEISLNNVAAPEANLLGERDHGVDLMRERLRLGRILRAILWIGLARRCLDLMCARVYSGRGELAQLSDKQLIRLHVFEAHKAISGARALAQLAARGFDAQRPSDIDIMTAKIAASEALSKASDSAIQIFGAEGVSDLTPLAAIHGTARASRFMDGADEALINTIGRRILDSYRSPPA